MLRCAFTVILSFSLSTSTLAQSQSPSRPLTRAEILGQLASGKFASYVAHLVKTQGINFVPDSNFLESIQKAGGEGILLDLLSNASATSSSISKNSDVDQPYYRLALCAEWLHLGSSERAKADCRAAVNENPTSAWAVLAALSTFDEGDDAKERLDLSRHAVTLAPDEPRAHTYLIIALHKALAKDGDPTELFEETKLAKALEKQDFWNRVSVLPGRAMSDGPYVAPPPNPPPDLLRALELEPDFAPAHFLLAYYFEEKLEFERVWPQLKEAVHLEPGNAGLHFAEGEFYARYEKYDEAAVEYREAARISPYVGVYFERLVSTLRGTGRGPEAVQEIKQALHWVPTNSNLSDDLVQEYLELEDFKSALAETRRFLDACKQQSHDEDCKLFVGRAKESLAWLLHENGELNASADLYKELLSSAPNSANLHLSYAGLLEDQGKLTAAEQHFDEAVRLEPNWASNHIRLGDFLVREKRFDRGIKEYEEALRLQPEGNEVLIPLAIARAKKGDLAIAIQLFREAVNRDEEGAYAHQDLGWALSLKKENSSAVVELRRALELDPNLRTARTTGDEAFGFSAQSHGNTARGLPRHSRRSPTLERTGDGSARHRRKGLCLGTQQSGIQDPTRKIPYRRR